MEPRVLILETSGRAGFVAVAEGLRLLHVRRLDETRRHARDLAPAVSDLLVRAQWRPRDVQAICVGQGPGSYTGLRVGVMAAKAFAHATGCALVAVETFAAVALQAPPEAQRLDVIADAQQEKVYVQTFGCPEQGAAPAPLSALTIRTIRDWLSDRDGSVWVSGPGLRGLREQLPAGCQVVDAASWDPQPASVLRIGLDRFLCGARDDVWSLEPLYLRPSSAEAKAKIAIGRDRVE